MKENLTRHKECDYCFVVHHEAAGSLLRKASRHLVNRAITIAPQRGFQSAFCASKAISCDLETWMRKRIVEPGRRTRTVASLTVLKRSFQNVTSSLDTPQLCSRLRRRDAKRSEVYIHQSVYCYYCPVARGMRREPTIVKSLSLVRNPEAKKRTLV